jgi:hypothetical protein
MHLSRQDVDGDARLIELLTVDTSLARLMISSVSTLSSSAVTFARIVARVAMSGLPSNSTMTSTSTALR